MTRDDVLDRCAALPGASVGDRPLLDLVVTNLPQAVHARFRSG